MGQPGYSEGGGSGGKGGVILPCGGLGGVLQGGGAGPLAGQGVGWVGGLLAWSWGVKDAKALGWLVVPYECVEASGCCFWRGAC